MWCAVQNTLTQRTIRAAVLVAVAAACAVARPSFAEPHIAPFGSAGLAVAANATGFALQVSLRNRAANSKSRNNGTEIPVLEYQLSTSIANDSVELGTTLFIPNQFSSLRLKAAPKETPLPHLLSWMEGWRMDIERGLFRPLRDHAFRLALAYSDIFETRSHPDKGGHGPGIVFRYDFRRPSARY
jgi:hypothetical protein